MWWRPLTPRSSIEAETFLSRNEKCMSLRGGQRPTRPPPVTIRSFQNVGNLGQHRAIVSVHFGGSFPPIPQFEKLEIHTVFLRFSNFDLTKNLSPNLLAKLRGAALDFFGECGLPHHPAGWFAMTCVTWGTFCWNLRNKKPACRLPRYAGILICGASEPRQSLHRPDPSGIRRESRPTGGWYLRWRGWCRPWQPEPGRPSPPCRPQNER